MKKELKTVWIVVAVLAILQIIGGSIYTLHTAEQEKRYTYVACTIEEIRTKQDGDSLIVEGITVSYRADDGSTVTAQMVDFPPRFSEGDTLQGRYVDDPLKISAQQTDWFTPVFLIVLGVAYAAFDVAALLLRKKLGLYALQNAKENP